VFITGNKNVLIRSSVPKTLILKEGAPVILIKNLAGGIFNGQRGTVHRLSEGKPPIININGNLHEMKAERFEIYDANQKKILASRTQVPLILAFAMTVHRAQGQTIENLEVDCSTFFAPGQLGVAIGRAVSKSGLCVRNFNKDAAFLKHPTCVYDFYKKTFKSIETDTGCCSGNLDNLDDIIDYPVDMVEDSVNTTETEVTEDDAVQLPRLKCPFNVNEFVTENCSSKFVQLLTPEFVSSEKFKSHLEYLYFRVNECVQDDTSTNTDWMRSYKSLNTFLVTEEHLKSICYVFDVKPISKIQNKMSSKLSMWIMDKLIEVKVSATLSKPMKTSDLSTSVLETSVSQSSTSDTSTSMSKTSSSNDQHLTEAGLSKLRYIAGVCVHKIRHRLKETVDRNLGKQSKKSKLATRLSYKKRKMLELFSVSEDQVDPNDPTMLEIEYKQNKTRGLTIVNDTVFDFFIKLHNALQALMSVETMHKNLEDIHNICRNSIDNNTDLLSCWISLFCLEYEENFEDEIVLDLMTDLYKDVTEHFLRLSIVDSLKKFKASIPRKKRQALRTKIQALGERSGKKRQATGQSCVKNKSMRKKTNSKKDKQVQDSDLLTEDEPVYVCPVCDNICEEEPLDQEGESIGCDKCNLWFHYGCVNLTGNEQFLKESNSNWYCQPCSQMGRSKGKGKGKGKSSRK
jgi:hypothetical protein